MTKNKNKPPPDQDQRDRIETELDRTLLVEAAAGTGKTTSMVRRMVALLAEGTCERIDTLAAVTFTRKAASELRARFQVELERAARENDRPGEAGNRLRRALAHVDRCFMGTIHAFCARLLRERPVEADVDVDFREADDREDLRIRLEAWDRFVADCYAEEDPLLDDLAEMGLEIGSLKKAFCTFDEYPDVQVWPAETVPLPDLAPARKALEGYVRHMKKLIPAFPEDRGYDKLMSRYELITRMVSHGDLGKTASLMEILEPCKEVTVIQRNWPEGKAQGKAEMNRWAEFVKEHAAPVVRVWREHRYPSVMATLQAAELCCARLRRAYGVLNYQDLLMKTAALLKENREVRAYFRERFTHLLVDEFQDTDPIQAEVMLYLTAKDPGEQDWRRCRPVPGSLFVVGDPKQSIYRFRRADIITYNEVKGIIRDSGGDVVHLICNFRAVKPVVDWVNRSFEGTFPKDATKASPAYVPLQAWRPAEGEFARCGVKAIRLEGRNKGELLDEEGDLLARAIRSAVDRGSKPGDFLIVTRKRSNLGGFAGALERYGLPHQVTGGGALNRVEELNLLFRCLHGVMQPENPVALVAALRSGLFGISDQDLYAFRKAGGAFSYRSKIPIGMAPEPSRLLEEAFVRLGRYDLWIKKHPPVAAFEMTAADLGLFPRAMVGGRGGAQAGSLAKAFELLRAAQADKWTAADLVEYLGQLVKEEEKHDGLPVRPHESSAVRVMNLHQVKGLEAPVVFLADPTGEYNWPVELCIDRSGKKVRGFLTVSEETGKHRNKRILAQPREWEERARKERTFFDAEEDRLRYVAATRAGEQLVVSQRTSRKGSSPWQFFAPHLEDCPTLEDPGEVSPPLRDEQEVTMEAVKKGEVSRAKRWERIRRAGFVRAVAKAPGARPQVPVGAGGEHGTEWGTVIHLLLQAAMADPGRDLDDLSDLAASALAEQGLDPGMGVDTVEVVEKVRRSKIWKRAEQSGHGLVEVPLQVFFSAGETQEFEQDTLLRGVIDLVFREEGGWVIVDYKTDPITDKTRNALVERYRSQVNRYRAAWRKALDEPVIEAGLYFTAEDRYETVKYRDR